MSDFDTVIVGAGVVGLGCAEAVAKSGRSVLVIERHSRPGQDTSSRNSGVIHAGLYYPTGSLKALTCVEGRQLLYERCRSHDIGFLKTGKLIVATLPEEEQKLEAIFERGRENGAGALELIGRDEVARLEPRVSALSALWSPETGIVDVHDLMYGYQKAATDHGALVVFKTRLEALSPKPHGWELSTLSESGDRATIECTTVINAAGLFADRVAEMAGLDLDALGYRYHWCKGDYFAVDSSLKGLVRHLVYPAPVHAGLGIHVTFDLGGRMTFGPDTEYVSELDYDVNPDKCEQFAEAARRYLPEVEARHLTPDYSGIRPKLQGPGDAFRDFVIEDAAAHGAPGLVNLIGIESPGVTASLAIARRAAALIERY